MTRISRAGAPRGSGILDVRSNRIGHTRGIGTYGRGPPQPREGSRAAGPARCPGRRPGAAAGRPCAAPALACQALALGRSCPLDRVGSRSLCLSLPVSALSSPAGDGVSAAAGAAAGGCAADGPRRRCRCRAADRKSELRSYVPQEATYMSVSLSLSVSLCLSVYTVGHGAFLPGAGMQNWTVHCPNPALCPRFAAGTEAVGWQQPYSLLSHLPLPIN